MKLRTTLLVVFLPFVVIAQSASQMLPMWWAAASSVPFSWSATGGDYSTNYTIGGTNFDAFIFTNSGSVVVASGSASVYVLVVAGGGGGGAYAGGGGGAGGLVYTATNLSAGTYNITVGAGGVGGLGGYNLFVHNASNGANSVFGSIVAIGGGRGGE